MSYAAWFNAKQERVGHVFQGRFNSVLIDGDGSWLLKAADYLHLNPARTASEGLGKRSNKAEGMGVREPSAEQIKQRLEKLRQFQWSSYSAYAGYAGIPKWLHTEVLLSRSGGKAKFRRGVQAHVTRGADTEAFERLQGRVALGTTAFVERAKGLVGKMSKEQPDRMFAEKVVDFRYIVRVVEEHKSEKWISFKDRHGDWGRSLVLYLARKRTGLTLNEIGEAAGGLDYKVVSKAVQRLSAKLMRDRNLRKIATSCLSQMSNVET